MTEKMTENKNGSEGTLDFRTHIKDLVKKSPILTLLNSGLAVGGLIAYLYFVKIGYLPEFNIQDATTLLVGLALMGVGTALGLGLCLVFPAWLVQAVWTTTYPLPEKILGSVEHIALARNKYSSNLIFSSIFIGLFVLSGFILFMANYNHVDRETFVWAGLILFFTVVISVCRYTLYSKKNIFAINSFILGNSSKFIVGLLVLSFAWLITFCILILIIGALIIAYIENQNWFALSLSILLIVLVIVSNSFLAAGHLLNKKNTKVISVSYLFIGSGLLIQFLAMPYNQISLISQPFKVLHLGNIPDATLIVTEEACATLNILRPGTCVLIEKAGCVRPQRIESRIGSEFLLSFDDSSSDKSASLFIPLRKEDITAWSYNNNHTKPLCLPKN